jgi:hypothetical protein
MGTNLYDGSEGLHATVQVIKFWDWGNFSDWSNMFGSNVGCGQKQWVVKCNRKMLGAMRNNVLRLLTVDKLQLTAI